MSIVELLKRKEGLIYKTPADDSEICWAEKQLGVSFSSEYKDYLKQFGAASFLGHELTGICSTKELNVVDVTKEVRQYHTNANDEWYVIEQTGIDDMVVWQSKEGWVYLTAPGVLPKMICSSLSEYVEE